MEFRAAFHELHSKQILSIAHNPSRRELYTGSEDTTIKTWESETGKLLYTMTEHRGHVTALYYSKELKVLFSGSVDGLLCCWGQSGKLIQKIDVKSPIYSICFNTRRLQLMAGFNEKVRVYQLLGDDAPAGGEILDPKPFTCSEHTDIVKSVVSCEGRFFSAGYDRKLVIYDSAHHGDLRLRIVSTVNNAHEAAITCMVHGKDADNSWIITGSFDRVVKLWSTDGNLIQRFDGFSNTITSVCYVAPTQSLWVASCTTAPTIYDPRSGINVSEFTTQDQSFEMKLGRAVLKHFICVPEMNEIYGVTNRKSIGVWRHNPFSSISILTGQNDTIECVTFSTLPNFIFYIRVANKEPLLIFSGGGDGMIHRWERMQLNTLMYSHETLMPPAEDTTKANTSALSNLSPAEAEALRRRQGTYDKNIEVRRKKQNELHKRLQNRLQLWRSRAQNVPSDVTDFMTKKNKDGKVLKSDTKQVVEEGGDKWSRMMAKESELMSRNTSDNFHRKERLLEEDARRDGTDVDSIGEWVTGEKLLKSKRFRKSTVMSSFYYEELDYLITGYEDKRILVWGYNEDLTEIPKDGTAGSTMSLDSTKDALNEGVSNRVSGLSCKFVLQQHFDVVTALVCFRYKNSHFLISSGWDRRLIVWDIATGSMHDCLRSSGAFGKEELAADGVVHAIDYSPERNEFGYSSSDKCAYIRTFNPDGHAMTLRAVLQGHEADVTCIKWNSIYQHWVTGSEDRTVRIWSAEGIPCLKVIDNEGMVTSLCIDQWNGCVVTGGQDRILRIFDLEKNGDLVQKNFGHADAIKAVIHLPSRNQYVTASWDQTIRVWHAHMKKGQRRAGIKVANFYETEKKSNHSRAVTAEKKGGLVQASTTIAASDDDLLSAPLGKLHLEDATLSN